MENIKWSEKVTNEEFLERIGEKMTFLFNILGSKASYYGHSEKDLASSLCHRR